MIATGCLFIAIFMAGALLVISNMRIMPIDASVGEKAKHAEKPSLVQWPLPLIYLGFLILITSVLIEAATMTNLGVAPFAGILLMGYGVIRMVMNLQLPGPSSAEKKKKNEPIVSGDGSEEI